MLQRFASIGVLVACGQAGCGRRGHDDVARDGVTLDACPGAADIKRTSVEGTTQLSYRVAADYPAEGILMCINSQLREKEWRALEDDFWNPGLSSSHVRGWTHFVDSTVQPDATVDQWSGQWVNQTGDIVWYSLRYSYPPSDRHNLMVFAGYIPADIAGKMPKTPRVQK